MLLFWVLWVMDIEIKTAEKKNMCGGEEKARNNHIYIEKQNNVPSIQKT